MTGRSESYPSGWGMARSLARGTARPGAVSAGKSLRGGIAMGNRLLLIAAGLALALPAAAIPEPAGIAANLRAPANEEAAFVLHGGGEYIYQCQQSVLDPNAYQW